MRFRAVHLRAILLPLGVAIASISAVAWYGFVKIPAQQRYITDRNLRLLKTKSAQIKSKVDNFDLSLDHAIEFFPRGTLNENAYAEQLREYVREFAPGLQIVDTLESDVVLAMRDRAGAPPRVVIQRDEGRNFLYLGHKHAGATIVAKVDIEQALSRFLATGTEFDALALVTRDGSVIAQQSSSGLELVHVDALRESNPREPAAASGQRPEPAGVFESRRASTSIANVILGSAEYQMYIQPVQLSLNAGASKQWRLSAKSKTPPDGDVPEEWALCGFVRADHFRAASSSISSTYLLWFGVALVIVCVAIPLLKLHMLSPSERLRGTDGVLVAATTFLVTALTAFCAIDVYYFHHVFNRITDEKLEGVAVEMRAHFNSETTAIGAQLDRFNESSVWRDLDYAEGHTLSSYRSRVKPVPLEKRLPTTIRKVGANAFTCVDPLACRDHVLAGRLKTFGYPYFELIVFDDQIGWQRIKWSTHGVTPFINLERTGIQYFHQLKSARLLLEARSDAAPPGGVSVIQSPNTGEIQTVFWKAFDVRRDDKNRTSSDLIGETMTTSLISMVNPVLPARVQFAVVDHTGRVMFHSDPTRRLQENFFLECEDHPALRAAVSGRRPVPFSGYYLGRRYRMYATPLALTRENQRSFQDPGWTVVVFQDMAFAETLNVATLAAAVKMFSLYGVVLALAWGLMQWVGGRRLKKWFWPDEAAGTAYRVATLVNGGLSVLFLFFVARLDSPALLAGAALLTAAALLSAVVIMTCVRGANGPDRHWLAAFRTARASFLFMTAAVPAIACFQVAYDFETTLLTRSGQTAVAAALEARADRIKAGADRATLCEHAPAASSHTSSAESCDDALRNYIAQRTEAGAGFGVNPWDVNLSYVVWKAKIPVSAVAAQVTSRFDAFLAALHLPYNDIAAEMAAALPDLAAGGSGVLPDAAAEGSATPTDGAAMRPPTHVWRHWLEAGNRAVWLAKSPEEASTETLWSKVERAVPAAGWWLVLAGVAGILYVLVRLVEPLYALPLRGRRSVGASEIVLESSAHALLIGPPGSGKSLRLARETKIRVFDARTRTFVDRRTVGRAVPVERRRHAYAAAGATIGLAWTEPPDAPLPVARRLRAEGASASLAEARTTFERAEAGRLQPSVESWSGSNRRVQWLDASRLPVDPAVPIGIDHFECTLDSREDRVEMLRFLEELIYQHKRTVWIASAREPSSQLHELSQGGPDASEMARWVRVFSSFRELRVGLASSEPAVEHADPEENASLAAPYYRSVWSACSQREQLALRQLAEEGVVNPRNEAILSQLMCSGLVRRDRTFHLMSETFGCFVVRALSSDEISSRERSDVSLPWASVTTAMLTVALGLGALLVLTSQQLVDAWVGYVPALAPAVPTVLKLFTAARSEAKPGVVNV